MAEALRLASVALRPVMPGATEKINAVLGYTPRGTWEEEFAWGWEARRLQGRRGPGSLPEARPCAKGPVTILPLDPVANQSGEALSGSSRSAATARPRRAGRCWSASRSRWRAWTRSRSWSRSSSPGERHFYAERPSEGWAIAGAESVLSFTASGPAAFEECQGFIDRVLEDTIAVGDQDVPFGGPHFFAAFTFLDTVGEGDPFESARLFVPRWQVARRGGHTTAVANLLIHPDSPIDPIAAKVLRAHAKFRSFEFRAPGLPEQHARDATSITDVGGRNSYSTGVSEASDAIARGEIEKVVLARAKDVRSPAPLHPLQILNGLRQRFPDCNAFSVANGQGQSFIGASPERLLRVEYGVVLTEALAGSAERGATASEDAALGNKLLASEKDLREQRIVLDSIVRRLSPLGLDLRYSVRPGLKRLSNIQHLHTPVEARLPKGVRLLDMLGRLHPTPAVGGHAPRAGRSL
jgi:menaquinone-specific isochorismate synthase